MAETRVFAEGTLRLVQASGSGRSWGTAASPPSALVAYVRSFNFDSARTIQTIMERGLPDHHKEVERAPIKLSLNCAWTGSITGWLSASGASVQMVHAEWRASAPEMGGGTGFYYQFYGVALNDLKIDEKRDEDTVSLSFVALGMSGANTTGYLS